MSRTTSTPANQTKTPNFYPIGNGFYVVRTQAGFKQAVRDFWGPDDGRPEVVGYPLSYPSVVALSAGYKGYTYVQASCMHINEFRKGLEKADPCK
jgi:hypothetical protein